MVKKTFINVDLKKKKVLLIDLENALSDGDGLTDFHIRREVLDKIRSLNIQWVYILFEESDDEDYFSKVKTVEFFVFSYCKVAAKAVRKGEDVIREIMSQLPHGQRREELFLSIGEEFEGIDYMGKEDFV